MKIRKHKEFDKTKVLTLSIVGVIMLILILISIIVANNMGKLYETEPLAVNEIITVTSEIESTEVNSMARKVEVKAEQIQNGYAIIQREIELIKEKDIGTIEKYFGKSDVFTSEAVSDKVKSTAITFISQTSNEEVIVHICSLDYDKLKEASVETKSTLETNDANNTNIDETVKKEVAKGIIKGQYDIHYNIPVILKNNEVVITENLKQAITGNWYHGINTHMVSIDCPIKTMEENK